MNRYVNGRGRGSDRTDAPGLHQVQKIELSDKHIPLRIAITVIALAAGLGTLVYGFMQLIGHDSGWQEITVNSSADMNCADQFTLNYDIGAAGASASVEYRAIAAFYTDACVKAYELFNVDQHFDDVVNLYDLNHQPNTVLTVDQALYSMLEDLQESESRLLYYGPLYETMENLYTCENDSQAKEFDPVYDSDTAADFEQILAFANDSQAVSVELLGDNQVRLNISDDYLQFAREDGIENYIDPYLMNNAFVCDYLADSLIAEGYTLGTLASYDGFSRCLDDGSMGVSFALYDRILPGQTADAGKEGYVVNAANVAAPNINAVVSLKSFPMDDLDVYRYFVYSNGDIRSPYLGEDGFCHTSCANLVGLSDQGSCSDILLSLLPYYISDQMEESELRNLAQEGISFIYCQELIIHTDVDEAVFSDIYDRDGISYQEE